MSYSSIFSNKRSNKGRWKRNNAAARRATKIRSTSTLYKTRSTNREWNGIFLFRNDTLLLIFMKQKILKIKREECFVIFAISINLSFIKEEKKILKIPEIRYATLININLRTRI